MKATIAVFDRAMRLLLLLLLALISFSGGRAVASPQHHGSMDHSYTRSSIDCQTRCDNGLSTVVLPQRPNEQKEKEQDPQFADGNKLYPFRFVDVKEIGNDPDKDSRILRPPDIMALNCIYRI